MIAQTYRTPKSLLLYLRNGKREAVGEISPLSGWSKETLDDVARETESLIPLLEQETWEKATFLDKLPPLSPSVQFGVELTLAKILDPINTLPVQVSQLLVGTEEEILQKQKAPCAKLKLGHFTVKEALSLTQQIVPQVDRLRIDINRSWSLEEAIEFASHFQPGTFEYIEEPVTSFDDLIRFGTISGHPIAVDEHFRERPLDELMKLPGLKAFICKPTLQGGLSYYLPLINRLEKYDCIMSSCYEGPIGKQQIIELMHRLGMQPHPAGLDT